jgi:hypothetical protein
MKAPQKRPRRPTTHDWLTNGLANLCEDLNAAQMYLDNDLPNLARMESERAVEIIRRKCAANGATKCEITVKVELGIIGFTAEITDKEGDFELSARCRRFPGNEPA